jgi:hypothetical protein
MAEQHRGFEPQKTRALRSRALEEVLDVNVVHHWLDLIYERLDHDRGEVVDLIEITTTDAAKYALNALQAANAVCDDVQDLIDRILSELPSGKLPEELITDG